MNINPEQLYTYKPLSSVRRTPASSVGEYMKFKKELIIAVLGVSAFVILVAFHALPVP